MHGLVAGQLCCMHGGATLQQSHQTLDAWLQRLRPPAVLHGPTIRAAFTVKQHATQELIGGKPLLGALAPMELILVS